MKEIMQLIQNAGSVAIFPHKGPDGDCMGSAFAMKLALEKMGKTAWVVTAEPELPKLCKNLCGTEKNEAQSQADLLLAVDCADAERLGDHGESFLSHPNTACIDHHPTNKGFAGVNWVEPEAAAAGELIYLLCKELGALCYEVAYDLYYAISSDTGGFRQSNTTPRSMRIAAELMAFPLPLAKINDALFACYNRAEMALMGEIYSSLEYLCGGKVVVSALEREQIDRVGADDEDVSIFAFIPSKAEGCEVSLYIRPKANSDEVKVSFRSNGDIDVAQLAMQFGGGGHRRASGCSFFGITVQEAKKAVMERLEPLL